VYDPPVLAVEARALAKTYPAPFGRPGHEALRGVELAVPAGAAFGLIGPNGAGKTTFVKALLGIVRPTAGTVRLLGGDPADPAVRARVGYLPERLQLPPTLDAREVLESVARLKRLPRAGPELARRLEEVGLSGVGRRRVGTFSKGMRQRLGLACALLGDPELLVLDEPTDGLDPLARVEVRGLLAGALARGATILLNSHLLAETERVCGRIGILVAGRVVREGELGDLCVATSRFSVRFEAPPAAVGFVPAGGAWVFEGEAPALNAALDEARRAGALVVGVARETLDLEQVLADAAGEACPRTSSAPRSGAGEGACPRTSSAPRSGAGEGAA
jgi:ABC-2 type transport system ATP-binding protein